MLAVVQRTHTYHFSCKRAGLPGGSGQPASLPLPSEGVWAGERGPGPWFRGSEPSRAGPLPGSVILGS